MIFPALLSLLLPAAAAAAAPSDTVPSTAIDEVVVRAHTWQPRPGQAAAVSVVDSAQLARSGHTHLLAAIQGAVPGLFVSERNVLGFGLSTGGAGGLKMRGVGGEPTSGVLVAVDGMPQFSGVFGHHAADLYKSQDVERVEVTRGPASVAWGSNAMGGVVNIITRQPRAEGLHGSLSSQLGSFLTSQSALSGAWKRGPLSAQATLSYDRTDGAQPGFGFEQGALSAKTTFRPGRHWQLQGGLQLAKFLALDPVYPREYLGQEGVYSQNVARGSVWAGAQHRHRGSHGHALLYYSWGNHFIHDPLPFRSQDHRAGLSLAHHFAPWPTAQAQARLDADVYGGRVPLSGGKGPDEAPRATLSREMVAEVQPAVTLTQAILPGLLHVSGGLRVAWSDKFGTQWVPQGSLCIGPFRHFTLRGSVSRGYRNPTFKELRLYAMANPHLRPESLTSYEVSLSTRVGPAARFEATGFWIRGKQTITLAQGKWENTGAFSNSGLELLLALSPAPWMQLHTNYSYLHTSLERLTAAPRHQFFLETLFPVGRKWQLSARLRSVAGLYVADEAPSESFATLSLRAEWRPCRHLRLHLMGDNLTNRRYTILRGYTMPGFTLQGGFRVEL